MDVSLDWRKRARAFGMGVALCGGLIGCGEELEGGAACPALCPGQNVVVLDTTFDAVALDTSLVGIPALGNEASLYLASRGDTLDVRAVIRFDSLASRFIKGGADSAITRLDSAYILLQVNTTGTKVRAPVRFDLYDVDTTEADTSAAVVRSLFRDDRLIGGTTIDTNLVRDSIRVYLNNAKLLAKVTGKLRLRLGLRATSAPGVEVNIGSIETGQSPLLRYDPAPEDTTIPGLQVVPTSNTPTSPPLLAGDYLDYVLVFAAPSAPTGAVLSVGGMPNRRSFLRFEIPSRILDSSTVLRASLLLTQTPNRAIDPRDSLLVFPDIVRAGDEVTDLLRAANLVDNFAFDSIKVAPGDSGLRIIEMASAVRQWAVVSASGVSQQRAIVLRSEREGSSAFDIHFFSSKAPEALRPRLRINYVLRTSFGIP